MARIGLLGRLMLILMAALLAVIVGTAALNWWEGANAPAADAVPFPRIEQAAAIIDLLRKSDPALAPDILQAVSTPRLRATLVDSVPPEPDELRRAPRAEALLRVYAGERPEDLRAYTSASGRPVAAGREVEGRLMRAVWRMGDGRVLVLDARPPVRSASLRLFGWAPGIWIGVLGLVVGALALLGAEREVRPLRRLTAAVTAFDGRTPPPPVSAGGAPDVRRLVGAVEAMQERVVGLLQERSLLIGAISHDLKTFLTRLRLRAEAVPDTDARARFVADLDGMTELIETALAFARGTTASDRRVAVDLADLVAVEVAERAALGEPVALSGADPEGLVVSGDPVALRRVLANLVDNALKFGRNRAEVSVEEAGGGIAVRVADDGPGVSEAERAAIFSPFFRLEGSRNRGTGGSGLGLAIARQIAEAHGGAITVGASRLGGAEFVLALPRAG